MNVSFWHPFIAAMLAAGVTTTGLLVIRRFEDWANRNSIYFSSFAAGVLISVSFLHLIPRAVSMTEMAPVYLLAGFLFLHLCNRFITAYVCDRPERARYGIGLIPMLGIGLHSFIDGMVYSVTFTVSVFTGTLAAIGMILHEFPEGIVTYVLLRKSEFEPRRAFAWAFVAAAITTPLGMLASYPFISRIDDVLLGNCLALSAGALIYVGASHLLPRVEAQPGRYSFITMAAGILVAIVIVLSAG
ncbi:ZIP family metal transporter [Emcibacter nanhaiensis]|uniref:ZIP family metal transporter n=1 Tax=Emcibacter nanhaiensis TaxID=1505037 RepID=A0A501PF99_9PROT|nr:ZIP family metal transporter [Emcibacter nanhaiensis]TPD59093.1 ZIP family metal transporter [Emcibacter nanhaiensis]